MCTFFFILVIILVIAYIIEKNKTPDKKSSNYEQDIINLPDINMYHSGEMDYGWRVCFWPSADKVSLYSICYKNHILTLNMKNGDSISGRLEDMTVRFYKLKNMPYCAEVKLGNKTVDVAWTSSLFTDSEFETIFQILMLAGTTYDASIMSSASRNLNSAIGKAQAVMKIIKFLNS